MSVDCRTEVSGAFRQVVTVDAHTLHADVSAALGGHASAPGPHDYFDVSLATCKALTATWYAKKNGYALDQGLAGVPRTDATGPGRVDTRSRRPSSGCRATSRRDGSSSTDRQTRRAS